MKLFTFFLILLFVASFAWSIYWRFVRPAVLLRLRYRIFACRDQLRLMAIHGAIKDCEPAYRVAEEMCNVRISALDIISLLDVMTFKATKETEARVQHDLNILKQADPALQQITEDVSRAILGGCIMNSPVFWPVLGIIMLASFISSKARAMIDKIKTGAIEVAYEEALPA